MVDIKRVGVCGSRSITDKQWVWDKLDHLTSAFPKIEVIHGACPDKDSPDWFADEWAMRYHYSIKRFWADWDAHGRAAGPIRNREMAAYLAGGGVLVAFWDGVSKGTANMIEEFLKLSPERRLRVIRSDG